MARDRSNPVDNILMFMTAHKNSDVISAIKRYSVDRHTDRKRNGFSVFTGQLSEIPKGCDWTKIGNRIYVRQSKDREKISQKVDSFLSAHQVSERNVNRKPCTGQDYIADPVKTELRCNACGEPLYKAKLCPKSDAAKAGHRVQLLCGNCDYELKL